MKTISKRSGSAIESGCGANIEWSQMRPVDPSKVAALGIVELKNESRLETSMKESFKDQMKASEASNKKTLKDALR